LSKSSSTAAYWTYALAFLGAHIAFMPLFVMMLPRRVEALAPDNAANWLSWLLVVGGIVAGLANVGSGAIGDRWLGRYGNRRGLIAIGAALLFVAYIGFAFTHSFASLLFAVIFFQIALNCCFSPLGALLADHFPDEVKGRLGGLMTAALPASTLLVVPIAWLFPKDGAMAFLATGILVAACILPLLILWPLGAVIGGGNDQLTAKANISDISAAGSSAQISTDFSLAWLSRLLVQTGAAFVISYIYLYITLMQQTQADWQSAGASEILATLTAPAAILAISVTLFSGYISDRWRSRRWPLFVFACLFGFGMAMLAGANELPWFLIGYGLVQTALAAYLAVDTALIAQLVSGHNRRGLLLGVMNLSNTLPSVIAPIIALLAFSESEVAAILASVFAGLALCSFLAGALVLLIRNVD
jgi:MFS family permease